VKLWVYLALTGTWVACYGVAHAAPSTIPYLFLSAFVLFILWYLWWRRRDGDETQERRYQRTYEASSEAAYSALCGALGALEYRITTGDRDTGTLRFAGGQLGPWVTRLSVDGTASVRQVGDRESEIVIAGHECRPDFRAPLGSANAPEGFMIYPEGMKLRAEKIFDEVGATIVTYSLIDAGFADPRPDTRPAVGS
jgi:hypothetical protein